MIKSLLAVFLLLACCSHVRADSFDTFQVTGDTFNAALGGFPATNYVDWAISGQLNGANATNDFFADLPTIFQTFGIDATSGGSGARSIHSVCQFGNGVSANVDFCNEQLTFPTSLPVGLTLGGSVQFPTPTAAPEPATLLLLGTGLIALGAWQRLRNRRSTTRSAKPAPALVSEKVSA